MVLYPRATRLVVMAFAAAGLGQLLDESFGVLHRLRQNGIVRHRLVSGSSPRGDLCPHCGSQLPREADACPECGERPGQNGERGQAA